jgi:formate/nitrite transporter FocA (FNT family)
VYIGNLIGATLCAYLIVVIGPALHDVSPQVLAEIATRIVDHPAWVILISGVVAGWLMGLVSWLVTASRDTISQIVIIWLFTGAIGLGHLHHSILGATEVLGGVFAGEKTTWAEFGHFLLWATIGNAIGGAGFVALLKFGHARTGEEDAMSSSKRRSSAAKSKPSTVRTVRKRS